MLECGGWANIRPTPRRVNGPTFSLFLYRYGNIVERLLTNINHFGAMAAHFEKHAISSLALVELAASRIQMRLMDR